MDFVVGWTKTETAAGQGAKYNLLNTEEHATGSTNFNSVGVQNFVSYHQGVDTNAWLIKASAYYSNLYHALLNNDDKSLGFGGAMSEGVDGDLQVWVSGRRNGDPEYPKRVIALQGQGALDQFAGDVLTREQLVDIGLSDLQQAGLNLSHLGELLGQLR